MYVSTRNPTYTRLPDRIAGESNRLFNLRVIRPRRPIFLASYFSAATLQPCGKTVIVGTVGARRGITSLQEALRSSLSSSSFAHVHCRRCYHAYWRITPLSRRVVHWRRAHRQSGHSPGESRHETRGERVGHPLDRRRSRGASPGLHRSTLDRCSSPPSSLD